MINTDEWKRMIERRNSLCFLGIETVMSSEDNIPWLSAWPFGSPGDFRCPDCNAMSYRADSVQHRDFCKYNPNRKPFGYILRLIDELEG